MWFVKELEDGTVNVECVADLKRHNRAVNIVRFSPDGKLLASADDGKELKVLNRSVRR
jgi:chromatin assembly factor 1 subunit B